MRGDLSRVQRQYFYTEAPGFLPALIRAAIVDAGRLQICAVVFGPAAAVRRKRHEVKEKSRAAALRTLALGQTARDDVGDIA